MMESVRVMVREITRVLCDESPSIYLFGSSVRDDFKLGWSDIDLLCLTEKRFSAAKAQSLVLLRQTLAEAYPDSAYMRLFEGGIIPIEAFLGRTKEPAVYWGTSGQRIVDSFALSPFSVLELKACGMLLHGPDVREHIPMPTRDEIREAVRAHYETIRAHARETGESLYSAGWLLDIARCLYTLETGDVIAKTAAGEWALEKGLPPEPEVLRMAVCIRKEPLLFLGDAPTRAWLASLGPSIQRFADVLEDALSRSGAQREEPQ